MRLNKSDTSIALLKDDVTHSEFVPADYADVRRQFV